MSDLPKLAKPAQRALLGAGIGSLDALSNMTQAEVAGLHGMGPSALLVLKAAMAARGLAFRPGLT